MKSIISVVVFISTVLSLNAFADATGPGGKAFYKLIETYRQTCTSQCQAPFKKVEVFNVQNPHAGPLPSETQDKLESVAFNQAQIWGDTILEGDYTSDGKTRLDRVTALYENDKFIGYQIRYSERAWYIAECGYDGSDEGSLGDCQEGRIHESTFVSPDFKTYFRDEDEFADFEG